MSALREKIHNDLRIRNLAENAQKSYLPWIPYFR